MSVDWFCRNCGKNEMIVECHNNTCYSIVVSLWIFLYSPHHIFFSCRARHFPIFFFDSFCSICSCFVSFCKRSDGHTTRAQTQWTKRRIAFRFTAVDVFWQRLTLCCVCCEFVWILFSILLWRCRCCWSNNMWIIDVSFYRWVTICVCCLFKTQNACFRCDHRQSTKTICYYFYICAVDSLTLLLFLPHLSPFSCTPVSVTPVSSLWFVFARMQRCHTVWFFSVSLNSSFVFGLSCGTETKVSHCELNYCAITTIFVEIQESCRNGRQIRCWQWVCAILQWRECRVITTTWCCGRLE